MTLTNDSHWRLATVIDVRQEAPTVKTLILKLPDEVRHAAGQHYEIRLTAEDGYQAARLYSAASIGIGTNRLELTIMLVAGGEVSPYLFHEVTIGDQLEVRGPLGKFFVWQPTDSESVLLIGGGSGVVPLRCMLQAHQQAHATAPMMLVYSARSFDDIIYKDELLHSPNVHITLTHSRPTDWTGHDGLIDATFLRTALAQLPGKTTCYVCGRTPFVEAMNRLLLDIGMSPVRIKAERFGALEPPSSR